MVYFLSSLGILPVFIFILLEPIKVPPNWKLYMKPGRIQWSNFIARGCSWRCKQIYFHFFTPFFTQQVPETVFGLSEYQDIRGQPLSKASGGNTQGGLETPIRWVGGVSNPLARYRLYLMPTQLDLMQWSISLSLSFSIILPSFSIIFLTGVQSLLLPFF